MVETAITLTTTVLSFMGTILLSIIMITTVILAFVLFFALVLGFSARILLTTTLDKILSILFSMTRPIDTYRRLKKRAEKRRWHEGKIRWRGICRLIFLPSLLKVPIHNPGIQSQIIKVIHFLIWCAMIWMKIISSDAISKPHSLRDALGF
jgi:hypothetical protein